MAYCLFWTNSKNVVAQTHISDKITNTNTYLSMHYKFTYSVNGLKGSLTEQIYLSVFTKIFSFFYFCLICFVLVMQNPVYTKTD